MGRTYDNVMAAKRLALRELAADLDALMETKARNLQPGIYVAAEYLREKARNLR